MRNRKLLVMMLMLGAFPALAQRGPAVTLKPANAKLAEEFTMIVGVRELADGRVLISDERENRVVVADFAKGTATAVGRTGNGPGEYRRASSFFALTGDSTLMPQDNGGSWVIFAGSAAPTSISPDQSIGSQRLAMIGGFDTKGNALTLTQGAKRTGVMGIDSLEMFLHTRSTHKEENVGRSSSPYGSMPGTAPSGGALRMAEPKATGARTGAGLFQMDRAVLFADGWIATARLHPYRIDWRAPDGNVMTGPVLLTDQLYNDNDKGAYLKREAAMSGKPARELANVYNWPEFIPPFNGMTPPAMPATDGRLWIHRTVTAVAGNRYDIIDRRGVIVGVLTLPEGERIVGFGAKSVYVAVTNSDGIQKLQRHPMDWATTPARP